MTQMQMTDTQQSYPVPKAWVDYMRASRKVEATRCMKAAVWFHEELGSGARVWTPLAMFDIKRAAENYCEACVNNDPALFLLYRVVTYP